MWIWEFLPAMVGGALIGLSAAALWRLNGRIAGVSGIVAGLVQAEGKERPWRAAFVAGLLVGGFLIKLAFPTLIAQSSALHSGALAVAGLLVGFGARLGGGCTSGHGLCGVSRLSKRSLAATGLFMSVGAAAVYVARLWAGRVA